MSFSFEKTEIEGIIVVKPHMFEDHRGLYKKNYEKLEFQKNGIHCEFTESSDLYSKKGALRGLHYQTIEAQAKLIHVISGAIYDVAIDMRKDSKTFGKYHTDLLYAGDNRLLFIPEGFAHGFLALEDNTIFHYECSGKYIPEACGGILWCDQELNIKWPLKEYDIKEVILTEKDKNWPTFSEWKSMERIR